MKFFHWSFDIYLPEEELPLYTSAVPAGTHPPRQFHEHGAATELVFVSGGSARHLEPPFSARISEGDILLIPPGVIHGYDDCETLDILNVVYDAGKFALPALDTYDLSSFGVLFPSEAVKADEKTVRPILHLEEESFAEMSGLFGKLDMEIKGKNPGRQFYSVALLMELLVKLARFSETGSVAYHPRFLIGGAIEYMRKNFKNNLTMEMVGKAAGMSRRNLFRHFKTVLGCSPLEYLTRIRLQRAAELLLQTDISLAEVAYRCGFCDSNYFSKQFARFYSVTPFRFRKKRTSETGEKMF